MSDLLSERRIAWTPSMSLNERLNRWSQSCSSSSRYVVDEPLNRHSSLRIGGPAEHWIEVGNLDDLSTLLAALADDDFHCVGLGSNTLFPDEGIKAPVIRLVDELASWAVRPGPDAGHATVEVMAGAINAHLVRGLLSEGWIGAEFLSLIPGTFGGAVALNAGTKDKELKAILESVWLAFRDEQEKVWRVEQWPAQKLAISYRHTALSPGTLVIGGCLSLETGDVSSARGRIKADKMRRNRTQPYRLASVGSTFANPDGDYAGRLIEEVGLKGQAIGGARISSLHANFFINDDDATAADFLSLMALARYRVRREFEIDLRPEVRFVGFDGRARLRDLEQKLDDTDV